MASASQLQRYKLPTRKALAGRIVLEILALCLLGYPMLHIYVFLQGDLEPQRRGFFCDDESIKYPNVEEEISVGNCVIIWICIVIFFICLVEGLLVAVYEYPEWKSHADRMRQADEKWDLLSKIPLVIVELYRMLGYFFIGALGALLTTEMAKYKIGRLRPYFLSVCNVSLTDELCKESGYNKYVTDYTCIGDEVEVREARKSFLSGHSSFSFYCSTFLIIYLQARLGRRAHRNFRKRNQEVIRNKCFANFLRGLKILRPFCQFGFFALALYIAFTRIVDYKHHYTDIMAGIAVGVIFALIILLFLVDLFKRPRSFEERFDEYDLIDMMQMSPATATAANNDRYSTRNSESGSHHDGQHWQTSTNSDYLDAHTGRNASGRSGGGDGHRVGRVRNSAPDGAVAPLARGEDLPSPTRNHRRSRNSPRESDF